MEDLIVEYRKTLKQVKRTRDKATDEEDRKLLSNCCDSLKYAIDYMVNGKAPDNRRGITNLSYQQREIPEDPQSYAFIKAAALQRKNKDDLNLEDRELLDDLLALLTEKEREAFVLVRGSGYSFGQVAELMGVAKGTVQNMVMRAERKLHFVVRKPPIGKGKYFGGFERPVQRVMF